MTVSVEVDLHQVGLLAHDLGVHREVEILHSGMESPELLVLVVGVGGDLHDQQIEIVVGQGTVVFEATAGDGQVRFHMLGDGWDGPGAAGVVISSDNMPSPSGWHFIKGVADYNGSPTTQFSISSTGDATFAGTVTAAGGCACSSDFRLKKTVEPLGQTLSRLLRLRGVTFEWREPAKHGNLEGIQTGMIAQEVEKVFPEWVGTDNDGYKTLSYRGFEALTVEALRELKEDNGRLAKQNRRLARKTHALEREHKKLAVQLAALDTTLKALEHRGSP
ncbi:tail fiber domain-containing protein [Desulfobulbus sp. AH-315-M07]|nr:tail fiber domain-containing protein [Desulfobulbus sp. AH-315-M07]